MVWQAKTSLKELLRRRKQTLQEWMQQVGIETIKDLENWCTTNGAELDVNLPKPPKAPKREREEKPAEKPVPEIEGELSPMAKDLAAAFQTGVKKEVKKHHEAGRSVWVHKDGELKEVPPPDKKSRSSEEKEKKDNDPSSGSD